MLNLIAIFLLSQLRFAPAYAPLAGDDSTAQVTIIAYPNPMGIESQIMQFSYTLPEPCNLIFAIYDPFGNLVHRVDLAPNQIGTQAGVNILVWNGQNDRGRKVASGLYYAVLKGWTHTATIFNQKIKVGVIW